MAKFDSSLRTPNGPKERFIQIHARENEPLFKVGEDNWVPFSFDHTRPQRGSSHFEAKFLDNRVGGNNAMTECDVVMGKGRNRDILSTMERI